MKHSKTIIWTIAVLAFCLLPVVVAFAQGRFSDNIGFDLNTGFDTQDIENPADWHEPAWTVWLVERSGVDPVRGETHEVRTRKGKMIDIMTDSEAIEVEWATTKWYESIGQSLFYAIETNRQPAIILLSHGTEREEDEIDNCKSVCSMAGIRLYVQRVPDPPENKIAPKPVQPKADPVKEPVSRVNSEPYRFCIRV